MSELRRKKLIEAVQTMDEQELEQLSRRLNIDLNGTQDVGQEMALTQDNLQRL